MADFKQEDLYGAENLENMRIDLKKEGVLYRRLPIAGREIKEGNLGFYFDGTPPTLFGVINFGGALYRFPLTRV